MFYKQDYCSLFLQIFLGIADLSREADDGKSYQSAGPADQGEPGAAEGRDDADLNVGRRWTRGQPGRGDDQK